MKRIILLLVSVICVCGAALVNVCSAQEFPLRAKYPQLACITTTELAAANQQVIVVDVRDQMEFRVLHIKGATLLPLETLKAEDMKALRGPNDARRIVVYCNGVTCEKSYKAAAKASFWGIPDVLVYDAGVFAWAKTHPQESVFFDETLTAEKLNTSLISESAFAAVCLEPAAFKARAEDAAYKVYDIRDRSDRTAKPITIKDDQRVVMDQFVPALQEGRIPKAKILIYDNVGKQVMWLQYYLEKYGVKEYYFLKGGASALK